MSKYTFNAKNNCSEAGEAACTYYRKSVPADSTLISETCVTIEETTEELYNITSTIKTNNDFSSLGNSCITYNPTVIGKPTSKEVAIKFEEEICLLKTAQGNQVSSICNLPISDCGLDLKTLIDSCNVVPAQFGTLLQTLIDEIDKLKTEVTTLKAFHP